MKKTHYILLGLKIITWIAFIGFSIEVGSKTFTFIYIFFNEKVSHDIYLGLDLSSIQASSLRQYVSIMSLIIAIPLLKANIWFQILKFTLDFSYENPFVSKAINKLENIEYLYFGLFAFTYISTKYFEKFPNLNIFISADKGEYLLTAGVIYIISQVFKRGVELKEENNLTI